MPVRRYDELDQTEKVMAGRIALNAVLDEFVEGRNHFSDDRLRAKCDTIRQRHHLRYQAEEAFMADAEIEREFRRIASDNAHKAIFVGHFDKVIDLERLAER
jgi:hypothetical protein